MENTDRNDSIEALLDSVNGTHIVLESGKLDPIPDIEERKSPVVPMPCSAHPWLAFTPEQRFMSCLCGSTSEASQGD